jgi:UDP-N-acetylmuramoylalanine--D-glutamate ligase
MIQGAKLAPDPVPWRRALVVGLGSSGIAAARLLLALGVEVRAYDRKRDAELPGGVEDFRGEIEIPPGALTGVDLVVLSPGVPPEGPRERTRRFAPNAEITGELGLGLRLVHGRIGGPWSMVPLVEITGTNGKSTVTALTGTLLREGGFNPFVGGNLGTPLCAALVDVLAGTVPWYDALVLECSSFQLETLPAVPNDVGMVLNVTPDHLDRYPDLATYADTKAEVFRHLVTGGLALLDARGAFTDRIAPRRTDLEVVHVGDGGQAWVEGDGAGRSLQICGEAYDRSLLRLPGRHNASNAVFAVTAARHLGVEPEACRRGLQVFEGLPHRMVLVRELAGVRWYDDSKATNVASALASLGGLDERFVLIAGGRGKGDDLTPLGELLRTRGRGIVTIGETAEQFAALAGDIVPAVVAGEMSKAVAVARQMAQPGDAVVLAPACASYDQFRSYAHRGDVFAELVRGL